MLIKWPATQHSTILGLAPMIDENITCNYPSCCLTLFFTRLMFRILAWLNIFTVEKSTMNAPSTELANEQGVEGQTGTFLTPNVKICPSRAKSTYPSMDFLIFVSTKILAHSKDLAFTVLSSKLLTMPHIFPILIMFMLNQVEGGSPKISTHTSLENN